MSLAFTICRRGRLAVWLLPLLVTLAGAITRAALPVGTAFTYQGHLTAAGAPANGPFDLQFALFDTETGGGSPVGPIVLPAVGASNGLFTVVLDFGANVFSGAGAWLEIAVRPAGTANAFVLLTPRQRLSPAPYAIYTLRAASLNGTLPEAQLPTNVARLDASQTFRGTITFNGPVNIGNSNAPASLSIQGNLSAGVLVGDGQGLTNVTARALSSGQMEKLGRVVIPFVMVTNAGNPPDVNGKGSVSYDFRIGKYEVNNNQYAAFLNAVGADDPHRLYSTNMSVDVHGGIDRSGAPGDYTYQVKPGLGHQPVVWVDFYDALRFCNWLHNGQPVGAEDNTTTEDGAYTLTPEALAEEMVLRNPGARFWLPSDDEWYKAAYHQPFEDGGEPTEYWLFPTRSNDVPVSEPPPGADNSANTCCETGHQATDVGAYPNSPSYYGTFDQAGNVQEWTEWTTDFTFLRDRRVRGGSWKYSEFYAKSTDFEFDTTDYDADAIGFRVAGAVVP